MQLPFTSAGTNIFWLDPSEKFINTNGSNKVISVIERHSGKIFTPLSNNMPTWGRNVLGKRANEGNGQPGFIFDGYKSMRINLPTNHVLNGVGKQIIYVGALQPILTSFHAIFELSGRGPTNGYFDLEFFQSGSVGQVSRGDDAGHFDGGGPVSIDTSLRIYTAIYDGTNIILRINGVQKKSAVATTSNAGSLTINQLSIGDWTDGSFPTYQHAYYIGKMGHQAFFYGNPSHTPTEVEDYMMKLYGL